MSLVRFRLWAPFAGLAHLVERHLAKVEVASSSLVARSRVNQDIRFGCPDFFHKTKRTRYRHPCAKRILIRGEAGLLRRTHKLHTSRLGRNVLIRMDGDIYFDRKRREYGKKRRIEQIFGGIRWCSSPPVMDRVADRLLFFTK